MSPDAREGEEVLDRTQLDDLHRLAASIDDPGFLAGLVERFLNEAASRLAQLRGAARAGDEATLLRAAHTLKGASATMGARRLASACQALEEGRDRSGAVGDSDGVARVAAELELATTALRAETDSTRA